VEFLDALVRVIANRFRSIVVVDETGGFQVRYVGVMPFEAHPFGTDHADRPGG